MGKHRFLHIHPEVNLQFLYKVTLTHATAQKSTVHKYDNQLPATLDESSTMRPPPSAPPDT